jgi:peptidoglycan/LPS O-acetylase OafA/YrhL
MNRIKPIDGLRTFAIIGVMWAHVWMFFGNLPMKMGGVDINRFLSFGGIGVDLFFVISGFCMYLMHTRKNVAFSKESYKQFIIKRWKRIAPAFYVAVIFAAFLYLLQNGIFPFKSLIYHVLFINIFNGQNILSPPFWSLSTEWHFYLILPLIFIADKSGRWIFIRIIVLMSISLVLRFFLFHGYDLSSGITVPSYEIWYRFIEFGFGILAARFYIQQKKLPNFLSGATGFIISFFIAFFGRVCMTTDFFSKFGEIDFIIRALGEPILTFGFGIMILNLITTESIFEKITTSRPVIFIGKISYSMYLWHWPIAVYISYFIANKMGKSVINMEMSFLLSLLVTTGVGLLSYHFLEATYFKKSIIMDDKKL